QRKPLDLAVDNLELLLEHRHAAPQNVLLAPLGERAMRRLSDRAEEILPCRVSVLVRHEKVVHSGTKRGVADEVVELLENSRRLVVDDRAVVALRLVKV